MAECFSSRSRRMAQLEDELAGQQRQLDTMRKALSNVVDVATHRHYKDQMAVKLANKADLDLMDKNYSDIIEVSRQELSEALANKADAEALEQCQREISTITQDGLAALESQHMQLSRALEEDRSCSQDVRSTFERLLSGSVAEVDALGVQQKALAATLKEKADLKALAEQERRLTRTESIARQLEKTTAEAARQQLSAVLSAEMSNEAMHQASEASLQKQMRLLETTKSELASLESRVGEMHGQMHMSLEQQQHKQEEWYKEKDHEQYRLAVSRKERQDHQLVQALAKKADVAWYEQQKAIIDATQVSLTALNGGHQDLVLQMKDKVDSFTLSKLQQKMQSEIVQARQETSEVTQKLDRHREHLDMARAQLLEVIRQQGEIDVSLSMKADKSSLEHQEDQVESLIVKIAALEQRQELAFREFAHMQEQVTGRHSPNAHNHNHASGLPPGMKDFKDMLRPPSSPREGCFGGKPHRHKAGSPYAKRRTSAA